MLYTNKGEILYMVEGTVAKQLPPPQLTPWKPGQSGNPNGRPRNSVTAMLKAVDPETSKEIKDKLIELAKKGDLQAIREFIDRTDGKVVDKHQVESTSVNITFVRADNDSPKEG
jgi:hypothetical protein